MPTRVGSQSMLIMTCSLVRPDGMRPGQHTTAGTRRPPSRSSVFLPLKGHVSENRSPPLSLVKTTTVSSRSPLSLRARRTRPDLGVHALHHLPVDRRGAAVEIHELLALEAARLRSISRPFPGPVRRGEMEAEKEALAPRGRAFDDRHRAVAEEIGEVAFARDGGAVVPEVWFVVGPGVPEVVEGTAADTVEVVVPALQRPKRRLRSEVPLTDEEGPITLGSEQRGQRRMPGRQADVGGGAQGLVETDPQAVLVPAGDEGSPGRRADRRVGVRLEEADTVGGDPVDVGRRKAAPAVAGEIGDPEVVGEDEDDVSAARVGAAGRRRGAARPRRGGRHAGQSVGCTSWAIIRPTARRPMARRASSPADGGAGGSRSGRSWITVTAPLNLPRLGRRLLQRQLGSPVMCSIAMNTSSPTTPTSWTVNDAYRRVRRH